MSIDVVIPLIGSLGYALGAVWVLLRRHHRPRVARQAVLYCALSLVWSLEQVFYYFGLLDWLAKPFLIALPYYGIFLLAIVFHFLTWALLGEKDISLAWLVFGISSAALLAALITGLIPLPEMLFLPGNRMISRSTLIFYALIAGWAIFMGAATLLIGHALRQSSRYYTLISYWGIALTLAVAGDGLFFAGERGWGNLFRLSSTLLAVAIVSARRLPAIGHTLRRSINYLASTAVAIGFYAIGLILALVLSKQWPSLNLVWFCMITAAVFALVFNPLLGRIQKRINRWIAGEAQDPTNLLRQYSQSITNILDLNKLATVAIGTAAELLDVQRGYLCLVDQEKDGDERPLIHLRGVKGMGDINPGTGVLQFDSPLAVYFRDEYKPITQLEIDLQPAFRKLPADEREWLNRLDAEVYVPIYAKNEWIGLIVLGPKRSGAEYSAHDLNLLSTLADQTAVALENTRLVEGLVRLNNEFRRAYAALDQANRHLERLDKTKSDFISIASHELRTPLTLISGASQMLLDDPEIGNNEYHEQLLSKIHTGTVRLHEIIDTMLDMAKIDTRALMLEPQPISLSRLIHSVYKELSKDAEERKQVIDLQGLEDLPSITADMVGLQKVFFHLIINAIKYTPDGGKITISGREVEPNASDLPRGGVEVIVSDTGIGIDPRYHELIFAKFYQTGELELHSSGKTKFKGGGPGLGLAIARGIVEAHHGRIWVESPGYDEVKCPGSQFHVILPLRPTDRPAPPEGSLKMP
jgi:signal transduction histidine kinase